MPASTPSFGIPKVALVNAKLIVDGQDRGARFFIVPICNEHEMYRGVISTRLPTRSGTNPLDFSITQFNNVQLPPTALVASDITDFAPPKRPLEAWWDEVRQIHRTFPSCAYRNVGLENPAWNDGCPCALD